MVRACHPFSYQISKYSMDERIKTDFKICYTMKQAKWEVKMWTVIHIWKKKLINVSSRMWGKERVVWVLMWVLIPHVVVRDELKVEIHISFTASNSYHQSYSTWFGATANFFTNCLCQLIKNIRFYPLFSNLWCWLERPTTFFVFPLGSFLCSAREGPWRGWKKATCSFLLLWFF